MWIEYDKQNDILYLNFATEIGDADEEVLSEDGDVVFRLKEGRLVSIMVLNFSEKIGAAIL
ncbi:DUF2283 domain-containing protein [Thermosphaera chiliense]|uniref:DUF2283 domain-containing protein n=2 Tax=Thermosphaera chiliense TaxID=3402707 RepID=A0A7M1UTN0_9CREN|nr:DUF2283 domain-containing protein [Thermosphaera aggregans]